MASEQLKAAYAQMLRYQGSQTRGRAFMTETVDLLEAVEKEHPELLPPSAPKFRKGQIVASVANGNLYYVHSSEWDSARQKMKVFVVLEKVFDCGWDRWNYEDSFRTLTPEEYQ